jgi:hypothetical protein
MIIRHSYQTLALIPIVILTLAFIFGATFYWSIPVADGEPKGGGDIIEVLLFFLLLGSCLLSILFSVLLAVVPKIRNNSYAIKLFLIGVGTPLIYLLVHPLIQRLV